MVIRLFSTNFYRFILFNGTEAKFSISILYISLQYSPVPAASLCTSQYPMPVALLYPSNSFYLITKGFAVFLQQDFATGLRSYRMHLKRTASEIYFQDSPLSAKFLFYFSIFSGRPFLTETVYNTVPQLHLL